MATTGSTLIDAGYPAREAAVFGAISGIGRSVDQLKHLIFTHGHPDHIGSAAAIVRNTGAPVGFDSLEEGRASQRKLASLSFDAAVFGHGGPITRDASARFRDKWGQSIVHVTSVENDSREEHPTQGTPFRQEAR